MAAPGNGAPRQGCGCERGGGEFLADSCLISQVHCCVSCVKFFPFVMEGCCVVQTLPHSKNVCLVALPV